MTNDPKEAFAPLDPPAVPTGSFQPGMVGHWMHVAHELMQRYWQQREKAYGERTALPIIMGHLERMEGQLLDISHQDDPRQRDFQFGRFVQQNELALGQSLLSAYVFASTVATHTAPPSALPEGTDDPLPDNAQDIPLTRNNLQKVANGLKAALAEVGGAYGALRVPNTQPRLSSRDGAGLVGLYSRFKMQLCGAVYNDSRNTHRDNLRTFCREAITAHQGGFYAHYAPATRPVAPPGTPGTPSL